MYVYERTESQLWTVGHYTPAGKWHSESDHPTQQEAAVRVALLNGANAHPASQFVIDAARCLTSEECTARPPDFYRTAYNLLVRQARTAIAGK